MPVANRKPCARPGCSALVTSGRCEAHRKEDRPSSSQRGYDARWRKVRRWYLSRFPVCEMQTLCEGALATQVHHIDHDTRNNADDNLQACCARCHASESGRWSHGR